ncbi:holo-ACP synthase [Paenibacillus sp. y28]|uniref:holo-ACP synthase n=1 Tax=Paenibacillus sp. y28 TaxID=3129110 RepID=UPI003016CAC7
MIIGIGTDLVELDRLRGMLSDETGARFVERVLTPAERQYAEKRKGRLAEVVGGRFAAKEAVVKALGCGIGKIVGFQDIEVLPNALGQPQVAISAAALQRLGLQGPAMHGEEAGGPGSGGSLPPAAASPGTDTSASAASPARPVRILLSITHTERTAAAFAVVEQVQMPG